VFSELNSKYPLVLIISLYFILSQRNLGGAEKKIANIYLNLSPFLKFFGVALTD
jgi:hypothetical protein